MSPHKIIGKVGAILIEFLHIFLYTDFFILHRLFRLSSFMQKVLPHENHVEGFFLGHAQSREIINVDIILYNENSPDIQGYSDTSICFTLERRFH